MEKIEKHKKIVRETMEEIAAMFPFDKDVEIQIIADDEHGHYLISSVGWYNNNHRELNNFVHLDVKPDAKVWVQHDGTDQRIALILVEKGVEKKDIVLGFQAPYRREMIQEFAFA